MARVEAQLSAPAADPRAPSCHTWRRWLGGAPSGSSCRSSSARWSSARLAGPGRPATQPSPRASEYGIQIQIPGQIPVLAGQHATPPWTRAPTARSPTRPTARSCRRPRSTGRTSVSGDGATVRRGRRPDEGVPVRRRDHGRRGRRPGRPLTARERQGLGLVRGRLRSTNLVRPRTARDRGAAREDRARRLGARVPARGGADRRQERRGSDLPRLDDRDRRLARRGPRRPARRARGSWSATRTRWPRCRRRSRSHPRRRLRQRRQRLHRARRPRPRPSRRRRRTC